MNVRVVDTIEGFDALDGRWNALAECIPSSFFSGFDYVRTAWKHFHKPEDRLFLLILSEGASIRGIAPFYIARRKARGIPHRVIRFIASWEGDRPRILTAGSEEAAWREILAFLNHGYRAWDVLELTEQPDELPGGGKRPFQDLPGGFWEETRGGVNHYVSLEGSWEDYLERLDSGTRKNWRRQLRRVSSLPGGCVVDRVSDPEQAGRALARFVALEQSGWKAGAGIGVGKDERHRAFYEDLLSLLTKKGQAAFHFLRSGAEDLAGAICFLQGGVIYGRHTAYSPAYAVYSPGVLLHAEIIREGFDRGFREFDLLSMKADGATQFSKTDWATGRRETVQYMGYRPTGRLMPLVLAKWIRRRCLS